MKIPYLMIAAILAASMSSVVAVEQVAAETPAVDQGAQQTLGAPRTPAEMRQRMDEVRQQHMQRMQANRQAMPMMGPRGGGMMNPEMMQRMQEMRRQRMEMMQAGRPAMPSPPVAVQEQASTQAAAGEPATDAPAESASQGTPCAQMQGRRGMGGMQGRGMKKQMMARKQQHMQATEQHLANIENLMRELVDLLKNSR